MISNLKPSYSEWAQAIFYYDYQPGVRNHDYDKPRLESTTTRN